MSDLIWYFHAGGFLMWPLLVCSLAAIAVIIERAVRLRRSKWIDPAVVEDVQSHIEKGRFDLAIARNRNSAVEVGPILCRGLEEFANTKADIETSLVEAGERDLQNMETNLGTLALLAKVSPLLGLLGTVLGMIEGFASLEQAGVGKEALAGAIRVALITTAAGLMVAIPCVVAGSYFQSRIRRLTAEFEQIFLDVIKSVNGLPDAKTVARASTRGDAKPEPTAGGPA